MEPFVFPTAVYGNIRIMARSAADAERKYLERGYAKPQRLRWYRENTTLSTEAIGRRFGVSRAVAAGLLAA